jgi:nucleoid-associated protein YgaU
VLLTGVVVGFRHPIARAIGTEVDHNAAVPPAVAPAPQPVSVPTPTQAAVAAAIAAVPTHAPRDPFRSLVNAGASVLAPEAAAATEVDYPATTPAVPPTLTGEEPASTTGKTGNTGGAAGVASSCTGTMHTVVSGDTLWSLAARSVKSSDSAKVTIAWHKIYRANRPPLSDPSMLPVGTKICLPSNHLGPSARARPTGTSPSARCCVLIADVARRARCVRLSL